MTDYGYDPAAVTGGKLTAPFVWHGGKRRWAEDVWARFGEVEVYADPFFGTGSMLLGSPRMSPREIVCDSYGFIPNFYRAIRADPYAVARWADNPSFHHDLYAVHVWLLDWGRKNSRRLMLNKAFYSTEAAGLWVWGVNLWIGGGWCADVSEGELPSDSIPRFDIRRGGVRTAAQRLNPPQPLPADKRPHIKDHAGGTGTAAQRLDVPSPLPRDQRPQIGGSRPRMGGGQKNQAQNDRIPQPLPTDSIPKISNTRGGSGTSAQREAPPSPLPPDKIPKINRDSGGGGTAAQRRNVPRPIRDSIPILGGFTPNYARGTMATRVNVPLADDPPWCEPCGGSGVCSTCGGGHRFGAQHFGKMPIGEGQRLFNWFAALAYRFEKVVVLNRDWTSAVTPTVLQHTSTSPKPEVAVFLDPPYTLRSGRSDTLYQSDVDGNSDDVAAAAYAWAVEHGDQYRIAYAMHVVDGVPDFPIPEGWEALVKSFSRGRDGAQDLMIFSPRCGQPPKTLDRALGMPQELSQQGALL